MATYSPDLRIELIANGAEPGTWGTTTNNTLSYVIDSAITGFQTVAVASANQALTYVNGSTATASANQAIYASLAFTTGLGTSFSVYAPPNPKQYVIWNNSSQSMTIYNSSVIGNTTPAGTGVTIPAGKKYYVFSNGTNFYTLETSVSFTGVVYSNGSALSAASGSEMVTAIGSSVVTNAANVTTTNFTITESGGNLLFKYGATTIASITSAGVFTTLSDQIAGGTP